MGSCSVYYEEKLNSTPAWDAFKSEAYPRGLSESVIGHPTETILQGEKETSSGHFYMDFWQGRSGNDVEELEQCRHSAPVRATVRAVRIRRLWMGTRSS